MKLEHVAMGIALGVVFAGVCAWMSHDVRHRAFQRADDGGVRLDAHRVLAAPVVAGNLAVWPVVTDAPADIGEFVTLKEAQERGAATVREVGSAAPAAASAEAPIDEDAAEVNRLVIENRGDVPILVCAGTLLRGGDQDRQVGEDVVVAPRTTLPIEVFCVEQGRWSSLREGADTRSLFTAVDAVALKSVRASAQYQKSQEAVWNAVADTGEADGADRARLRRGASSVAGRTSFLRVIEDAPKETTEARERLAAIVRAHFEALASSDPQVVGFAYAVNGEPVGVRTFANGRIFRGQFEAFLQAMVLDAEAGSATAPGATARAADVAAMVRRIDAGERQPDAERSAHRLAVRRAAAGSNSACFAIFGSVVPNNAPPVTEDWTAK